MKILVCGTRDPGRARAVLWAVLEQRLERLRSITRAPLEGVMEVVHGDEKNGVDAMARRWCEENGIKHHAHPADWARHGKKAGPIRNTEMLDRHPDIEWVLALHTDPGFGSGTWDMVSKAVSRSIPVEAHIRSGK